MPSTDSVENRMAEMLKISKKLPPGFFTSFEYLNERRIIWHRKLNLRLVANDQWTFLLCSNMKQKGVSFLPNKWKYNLSKNKLCKADFLLGRGFPKLFEYGPTWDVLQSSGQSAVKKPPCFQFYYVNFFHYDSGDQVKKHTSLSLSLSLPPGLLSAYSSPFLLIFLPLFPDKLLLTLKHFKMQIFSPFFCLFTFFLSPLLSGTQKGSKEKYTLSGKAKSSIDLFVLNNEA